MEKSQWYIGTPNGLILCVDERTENRISGRFYHGYRRDAVLFLNMEQLLFEMEKFFDELHFPYPTTSERSFGKIEPETGGQRRKERLMNDNELLSRHGELGTFIIRVQHRQNSSWQGRITWMDKDQTLYFRSMWEMLKLIESALDTVSTPEELLEEQHWAPET